MPAIGQSDNADVVSRGDDAVASAASSGLVCDYGSSRPLIAYLTGMFAASLGATVAIADQQDGRTAPNPADSAPTFDASDLNHIVERDRCAAFAKMISKTSWLETDSERVVKSARDL
jgi:hypothetical protein